MTNLNLSFPLLLDANHLKIEICEDEYKSLRETIAMRQTLLDIKQVFYDVYVFLTILKYWESKRYA